MGTPVAVPSGCEDEQYGAVEDDMKLKLCDFVGALVEGGACRCIPPQVCDQ